jgi:Iap family predicted aminopeptidase
MHFLGWDGESLWQQRVQNKWREHSPALADLSSSASTRLIEFSKRMEANLVDSRERLEIYMTHSAFSVPAGTPCIHLPSSSLPDTHNALFTQSDAHQETTDHLMKQADYKSRLLEEIATATSHEEQELTALHARLALLDEILRQASSTPVTPAIMQHIVTEASGAYNELVALKSMLD